jgi:Tfp pilus assembly protein PilO
MNRGHTDRLWAVGGALGAAVLLAVTWFFLISPQRAETAALQEETVAAQNRIGSLQRRLTELREQNSQFDKYQDQLDRDRQALPTDSGLSDFLRQVQTAGDAAKVTVNAVSVGEPSLAPAGGGQVYTLTITMTVAGNATTMSAFLDQIQRIQPRAVLISTASMAAADPTESINSASGMTLNMQVFIAPPAGATVPAKQQSNGTAKTSSEGTN